MRELKEYGEKLKGQLLFFLLCMGSAALISFLYDLPLESLIYMCVLWIFFGGLFFLRGYGKYVEKKRCLEQILQDGLWEEKCLPEYEEGTELLYQEILKKTENQRKKAEGSTLRFYQELTDYYTMWVHQIKTPIAALKLLLQEKKEENKKELSELFRIEQYVEMVLGYLRTEDISSDMVFQEYLLDDLVREQIHKFARIFVGKKLSLHYDGVEERVLTDGKWLGFVIGQLLSNSLKYTKEGGLSIYMSPDRPHTLVIQDTGIGVYPEDLPRVFEKGFTGNNGREDSHSTGIGLYLCGKIMKKLGHGISMESIPGEGTRVFLFLGRESLDMY